MQFPLVISVFSFLAACVVASAIVARNPASRISRLGAALIGCAGASSLLEILWNGAQAPSTAALLMRWALIAILPIGPMCMEVVSARWPELEQGLRVGRRVAAGSAAVLALLVLESSRFVSGAVPSDWGFAIVAGNLIWLATFHPIACVAATALAVHRHTLVLERSPIRPRRVIDALVGLIITALALDLVILLAGLAAPRFAPAALVASGAWFWRPARRGDHAPNAGAFAAEILDALSDGVALLRNDGRIRAINSSLEALLQEPRRGLIGRPLHELLSDLPEDLLGAWSEREGQLQTAVGESLPVSSLGTPLRDRRGLVIGAAVVVRDQREVVDLQRQLVTSARFAAVGELAAGIAHEVNNPLAFIQANLNQMQRDYGDVRERLEAEAGLSESILDEGEELVADCLRQIARVASIVREVRGFAHGGEDHESLCDVNALLEAAMRMARAQLSDSAEVKREYSELPRIQANEQDLKQLFLGLVIHASQPERGARKIRLSTEALPESLRICVEDDGAAYHDEELERAFDPGFAEQARDGEERLGLSIAYHIVRQQGGNMRLESEIGARTCVSVELPRTDEDALSSPRSEPSNLAAGHC